MKSIKPSPVGNKEMLENKIKQYLTKNWECNVTNANRVELFGCCGIVTYKDCVIELAVPDRFVKIQGCCLNIRHYYGGRIVISGRILSVEYLDCKEIVK